MKRCQEWILQDKAQLFVVYCKDFKIEILMCCTECHKFLFGCFIEVRHEKRSARLFIEP